MQFDGRIKRLEDNLDAKTRELVATTAAKEELAEKLEAEKKDKKEQVSSMEFQSTLVWLLIAGDSHS